jgi:hypothetical protein
MFDAVIDADLIAAVAAAAPAMSALPTFNSAKIERLRQMPGSADCGAA